MSTTSTPKTSDNSPFNKCLKNNTEGENLLYDFKNKWKLNLFFFKEICLFLFIIKLSQFTFICLKVDNINISHKQSFV